MSTTNRSFEFINYTSGSKTEIHENLTKVRTHVMHDFFRTHKRPHTKEKLEKDPDRSFTPQATRPGSLPTKSQLPQEEENQKEARGHKTDFSIRSASTGTSGSQSGRVNHTNAYQRPDSAATGSLSDLHLVVFDLYAHTLDPFDVLPVSGDQAMGDLLKTHFITCGSSEDIQIPWRRELNLRWQESLWDMAQSDKGMLHTLLLYSERERLVRVGRTSSVTYLFHIGRAIQAIKDGMLNQPEVGLSEVFFMLVSAQAKRAMYDRDLATAKIHMKALGDLVLQKEPWLQRKDQTPRQLTLQSFIFRHVLQSNLLLTSMTSEPLVVPSRICALPERWPQKLVQEALRLSMITMEYFPSGLDIGTAYGVVNEVHQLSLLLNQDFLHGVSTGYATSITTRAIYRLCRLKADLRLDANHEELFRPVDTMVLCSLIFAEKVLQVNSPPLYKSPFPQEIAKSLAKLVHQGLSGITDVLTYWASNGASFESLLWILYLGMATCLEAELACLDWFQNVLGCVAARLEICNVEHLEHTLSLFPWMTNYLGDYLQVVGERLGFVSLKGPSRT